MSLVNIDEHQQLILSLFNHLRNNVAGGEIDGLPKAVRMAKMSWCEDLSYLAQLNVMKCQSLPDRCHSTKRFAHSGQNNALFIYGSGKADYSDAYIIKKQIENWFSYRKYASAEMMTSFPDQLPIKKVVQFIIAVHENNTHVGCAAVRFSLDLYTHFILTCNFATSIVIGEPVYIAGRKAADACKKRPAFDYPNLCADNDIIEPDILNYYSLHGP